MTSLYSRNKEVKAKAMRLRRRLRQRGERIGRRSKQEVTGQRDMVQWFRGSGAKRHEELLKLSKAEGLQESVEMAEPRGVWVVAASDFNRGCVRWRRVHRWAMEHSG